MEKNVPERKLSGIIIKFETVLWTSQVKDNKPVIAPIEEKITTVNTK